jgi:hypothetical protein
MRNFFLLLLAVVAALCCSCKDDDDGRLDTDAMVYLNGVENPAKWNPNLNLTVPEVVRECYVISFWNEIYNSMLERGWAPHQKDTVNNRLLMYGTDIIDQDGRITDEFIKGEDITFQTEARDTIGYIPNATLRAAETAIREAYAKGNYTECYELFHTAFTFHPISATEYKRLKAQGLN